MPKHTAALRARLSELYRHFESPEDDDRSRQPDRESDPSRDRDDSPDPNLGLIDRVAGALRDDERSEPPDSPLTVEYANVVDRLAGSPQVREAVQPVEGRLALRGLCDEAGRALHDTLPQDAWEAAGPKVRVELAKAVHAQMRETYGLKPVKLTISRELEDDGLFQGGKVIVNERLLSDETPLELVNTIVHENRHDLQAEIMAGRKTHPLGEPAAAEVEAWRRSDVTYDPEDFFGEGYTYNAREVDAGKEADWVVEGYLKELIADQNKEIRALKQRVERTEALEEQVKRTEALEEQVKELREMVEKLANDRDPDRPTS